MMTAISPQRPKGRGETRLKSPTESPRRWGGLAFWTHVSRKFLGADRNPAMGIADSRAGSSDEQADLDDAQHRFILAGIANAPKCG